MTLAPVRQAGDVCPSPAIQPCPTSVLVIRTRAAVRYAFRTLGIRATREEVDDLMQETLLRLWTRYPKRWCRYPRRLMNRVALRILVDRFRFATAKKRDARKVVPLESAAALSVCTSPPDESLIAREELDERLRSCRAALPKEHWRAFVALFVLGLTSRQAATLFGCTPSTLDARSFRIRRALAERGITVPRRRRGGRS